MGRVEKLRWDQEIGKIQVESGDWEDPGGTRRMERSRWDQEDPWKAEENRKIQENGKIQVG
ncbi:hypothetical protein DV515_00018972 [Chloebia gouldiae]|uniref:Uncharacterized protein n=1 Tax=Chloebia gouldiae TaxID=44316 RepID=A0A3L8Q6C7_CHLGU|nr:hypothetical protein DV515_00018973 [Chloebia gouldiae]RLV62759.1 hypothetical protein DV515_00018972 [Chloebia gouldiae]